MHVFFADSCTPKGCITWTLNFVAARDIQEGEVISIFHLSHRRGFELRQNKRKTLISIQLFLYKVHERSSSNRYAQRKDAMSVSSLHRYVRLKNELPAFPGTNFESCFKQDQRVSQKCECSKISRSNRSEAETEAKAAEEEKVADQSAAVGGRAIRSDLEPTPNGKFFSTRVTPNALNRALTFELRKHIVTIVFSIWFVCRLKQKETETCALACKSFFLLVKSPCRKWI